MPETSVPSRHVLRAALRVLECVGAGPTLRPQLRAAYSLIPTDGVFAVSDFVQAELTLINHGIITVQAERCAAATAALTIAAYDESTAVELLLAEILSSAQWAWLSAAVQGEELRSEFIPEVELVALASTFPDALLREAFLLSVGCRFSREAASQVGSAGEEFVLRLCQQILTQAGRPDLAGKVKRVSLVSDLLGYDIVSPTTFGEPVRLEVKTASDASGDPYCFLSRNEAIVAARDDRWRLVLCAQGAGELRLSGWCSIAAFARELPRDESPRVRWASCRMMVPRSSLQSDLRALLVGL